MRTHLSLNILAIGVAGIIKTASEVVLEFLSCLKNPMK